MLNRYSNPFPFSGNNTMCEKCSFSPPTQSAVTSSNIIVWSIWISHVEDTDSSYKYTKFFAKRKTKEGFSAVSLSLYLA